MNRETESALIGKWRIIEMELWDTDYLDMVERAYIRFDRQGGGEFVFGVVSGMTRNKAVVTAHSNLPARRRTSLARPHPRIRQRSDRLHA